MLSFLFLFQLTPVILLILAVFLLRNGIKEKTYRNRRLRRIFLSLFCFFFGIVLYYTGSSVAQPGASADPEDLLKRLTILVFSGIGLFIAGLIDLYKSLKELEQGLMLDISEATGKLKDAGHKQNNFKAKHL